MIVGVLIFICIVLGALFSFMNAQRKQTKTILAKLSHRKLECIRVSFNQSQSSRLSVSGGMFPSKAELYFDQDLMLICPNKDGFFNMLSHINLPIIFTRKVEEIMKETGSPNVINPDKIKLSEWNSLSIKYKKNILGMKDYSTHIKVIDKKDKEKMNLLKNTNLLALTK